MFIDRLTLISPTIKSMGIVIIEEEVDLQLEKLLVELLQEVLTAEGFMVNLEEEEDNFYIVEASCPYHHVGEDHPEICVVDQELIAHFVSSTPKRVECILDGDKQCKYKIKKNVIKG